MPPVVVVVVVIAHGLPGRRGAVVEARPGLEQGGFVVRWRQ